MARPISPVDSLPHVSRKRRAIATDRSSGGASVVEKSPVRARDVTRRDERLEGDSCTAGVPVEDGGSATVVCARRYEEHDGVGDRCPARDSRPCRNRPGGERATAPEWTLSAPHITSLAARAPPPPPPCARRTFGHLIPPVRSCTLTSPLECLDARHPNATSSASLVRRRCSYSTTRV
eukprot:ctg_2606.g775